MRVVGGGQRNGNSKWKKWGSDVLFGRGIPASLVQPRPFQPADGVLVFDGAGFGERARSESLERMVSEELAADFILYVSDRQRAK